MCTLYSLNKNKQAVATMFRVPHNRSPQLDLPLTAIFPRYRAPVVRRAEDGEREIAVMSWGFILLRKGYAPKPVVNTRDDQVRTTKFWTDSFEKRRCLVPATSFCEPHGSMPSPVTLHWFALRGDEPRPLFAFPGIWRRWQGPIKKDGPNVDVGLYSILTAEPNSLTMTINHERSPVLLTREAEFEHWLTGTPDEAFALLKPHDPDAMRIVREGFEKEDVLA